MSFLGYAFSFKKAETKKGYYLLYSSTAKGRRYIVSKDNYILGTYDRREARRFSYLSAKRMQSGSLKLEKL